MNSWRLRLGRDGGRNVGTHNYASRSIGNLQASDKYFVEPLNNDMRFRQTMKTNKTTRWRASLAFGLLMMALSVLTCTDTIAQQKLTLSEAIQIARESSRNIKKSKLNLYGNQRSLDAQRAALKSRFALAVTPFDYNRQRSFNDLFSTWNTNEDYNSFANFSVSQPIVATDGTISLINRFGYRDNYSEF